MKKIVVDALPFPYECDLEKTAFIIIDMQRDFCYKGGFGESLGNDVTLTMKIIPVVEKVLNVMREHKVMIIHTREGHDPSLKDCPPNKLKRFPSIGQNGPMGRILIRGEYGHDIVDELKPLPNEVIIDKPGKGAFYNTNLLEVLTKNGITHLIFAGVTTHVCVQTTIREANDRGFDCLLLDDASAAFDINDHLNSLHMINQQNGIFGWTTSSQKLLEAINK